MERRSAWEMVSTVHLPLLLHSHSLMEPPASDRLTDVVNAERSLRSSSAASVKKLRKVPAQMSASIPRSTLFPHVLVLGNLPLSCICNQPLLSGSPGLGSRKRYCSPTITELRLSTGFQSSRRMLRHTFPSRSMLGW